MSNFLQQPFRLIWDHRDLLLRTSWNQIKSRYAGSVLGLFWLIIYPILFLTVYASVNIFIYGVRLGEFRPVDYVVVIFCGLIPFIAISEIMGAGTGAVIDNTNLIKNTLFPIELIPLQIVVGSQPTQVIGFVILFISVFVLGKAGLSLIFVPLIWICQLLFMSGLAWLLSSLTVYLRDIRNIASLLVLILMFVSPIGYTLDMIPNTLKLIIYINPLSYIILAYQGAFILDSYPNLTILTMLIVISFATFYIGYWVFSSLKPTFSDYA